MGWEGRQRWWHGMCARLGVSAVPFALLGGAAVPLVAPLGGKGGRARWPRKAATRRESVFSISPGGAQFCICTRPCSCQHNLTPAPASRQLPRTHSTATAPCQCKEACLFQLIPTRVPLCFRCGGARPSTLAWTTSSSPRAAGTLRRAATTRCGHTRKRREGVEMAPCA